MFDFINKARRRFISKIRVARFLFFNSKLKIGKNFSVGSRLFVSRKNEIIICENVYIGNNCHLAANVIIGNDVLLASYVSLVGGDHVIDNITGLIRTSGRAELRQIVIEDNVWIGHGVIILHGVRIKSGAVVAAGSVVKSDIGENQIWGGNPAKFIRHRKLI